MAIEYIRPGISGTPIFPLADLPMRDDYRARGTAILYGGAEKGTPGAWNYAVTPHQQYLLNQDCAFDDPTGIFDLVDDPVTGIKLPMAKNGCSVIIYMGWGLNLQGEYLEKTCQYYEVIKYGENDTLGLGFGRVDHIGWGVYHDSRISETLAVEILPNKIIRPAFTILNDVPAILNYFTLNMAVFKKWGEDLNA